MSVCLSVCPSVRPSVRLSKLSQVCLAIWANNGEIYLFIFTTVLRSQWRVVVVVLVVVVVAVVVVQ